MKYDYERPIVIGDKVELHVVEYNSKPVLETHFIQYDSEIRAHYLNVRGIDEHDFTKYDEDYVDGRINFHSVRIFHLAKSEKIKLEIGDKVRGVIRYTSIAKEETKDGRKKVHIAISDVMRVYH